MKAKEELKELKMKSAAELQKLLKANREKLGDLRFKISQSQLKNIREFRALKKKIAKILTIINEKRQNPSEK
ncbi:MAG: 50S ribosomal protein L29 [Candidatus Buchananbacteria bacterium RBG_13_39_9]|uniref:Large ribosomal subunit protein uL29 n=1 Tax=Candidatus Buchananbacteria bacterium RBG_13_39_9 TaxID=1797531 RepID=A0A1G1XNJ5_9BACT|nr:MAG: 50S ribosomal protein L29 [Candidatus Buchananbacteria bacterium RBG_13_39_9]